MDPLKCSECSKDCYFLNVTKSKDIKELFECGCDVCKRVFCKECHRFASSEIRAICSSCYALKFLCPECLNTFSTTVSDLPKLSQKINSLEKEIQETRQRMNDSASHEKIKNLNKKLDKTIVTITFETTVKSLRVDMLTLSDNLRTVEVNVDQYLSKAGTKEIEKLRKMVENKPSYADVLASINQNTKIIKKDVADMQTKLNYLERQTKDFASEDIPKLEEKLKKLEQAPPITTSSLQNPMHVEPTIAELQEREKRAANILIFGMPEIQASNKEERLNKELETSRDFIKGLNSNIDLNNIKTYRLGKYVLQKTRPVKVLFSFKEEARNVFRFREKLHNSGKYLKFDHTFVPAPAQRSFLRGVLQELADRQSKGESDIKIKYLNDIPKIVKAKSSTTSSKNEQH